jgi:hypothetical protein
MSEALVLGKRDGDTELRGMRHELTNANRRNRHPYPVPEYITQGLKFALGNWSI